jgi:hypothetical protein
VRITMFIVLTALLGLLVIFTGRANIAQANEINTGEQVYICEYLAIQGHLRLQKIEIYTLSDDYVGMWLLLDTQKMGYVLAAYPQFPEPTLADCPPARIFIFLPVIYK